MTKKTIFLIVILTIAIAVCSQTKENQPVFNLGFEQQNKGFPSGWSSSPDSNYRIYLDSAIVREGRYSAAIEFKEGEPSFKPWTYALPNNYIGNKITLSGYIKTENVTDGYAGLWMRIDPGIAFDNMNQRGITGTTDWTKYEITLPMNPSKTKQILIGGLLIGKGKMWLDNLTVTIDGKDITDAGIYEKKTLPAELDNEFANGSGIVFPPLNEQSVSNLELLGKLWGFLKYHHPEVGKGNYNWDYELFRILDPFLKVNNNAERDKVLLGWISKYGEVPVCKSCEKTPSEAFLKPGLSWIENSDMNTELKKAIQNIYSNRHQGEHYYIGSAPYVGNPEFLNENAYYNMPYPDDGFRLLTLYKYWNMIHYFFPNKYMTDKNWDTVLKEYIPQFISAKDELEYELAAIQIIGDINDTHANLWAGGNKVDSLRGRNYAPFQVRFIEQKLVVTDYYNPESKNESAIEVGDVITHINGEPVELIVENLKKYYPASNQAARLRNISYNLLRSNDSIINIRYVSSGDIKQRNLLLYDGRSLDRHSKANKDEKCYKLLDGNIGYITLARIKNEDIPIIKESFKDTKGIIIDIRNYPSTFVPFTLGSYFVSQPAPFVKFTIANTNNPGEFRLGSALVIQPSTEVYKGKLVVIVNESTQSQAEYTAMAFRAGDNTTIVGSTTAGADGNVSAILLPGGLRTMISGIGVYYPDGKVTQRIGIVPDVIIEPTIEGIKQGKDELLNKAIEIIEAQ